MAEPIYTVFTNNTNQTSWAYAEVSFDILSSPSAVTMGIQDSDDNIFYEDYEGNLFPSGGTVTPFVQGNVMMIAYNQSLGYLWLGIVGSGWFNSGNPATNSNPLFTGVVGPALVSGRIGAFSTEDQYTVRTKSSQFTGSVPAGYSSWSGG